MTKRSFALYGHAAVLLSDFDDVEGAEAAAVASVRSGHTFDGTREVAATEYPRDSYGRFVMPCREAA